MTIQDEAFGSSVDDDGFHIDHNLLAARDELGAHPISAIVGLEAALAAATSLPSGGSVGQVLAKSSADDGDVAWVAASSGGGSVYVYNSSGGQDGNRYSDWADLMAAMAAGPAGPKWLVIEENETVPVGSWDLTDVILTTPRIIDWWLDGGVTLTFPEGATVSAWPFPFASNALAVHNIGDPLLEVTETTCAAVEKGAVFASSGAPMFLITGDSLTFSITLHEEGRLFNGTEVTLSGPFGNPSMGDHEIVDDQGNANVVAIVQDASRITVAPNVVRGGGSGGVLACLNYGVAAARIDYENQNYSGTIVPFEVLNAAQAANLGVAATPTNYAPTAANVEAHLAAIDAALAGGASGASAFEIATANGFEGDEVAWLLSLVGAPGEDGVDGVDGADGVAVIGGEDENTAVTSSTLATLLAAAATIAGAQSSDFYMGVYFLDALNNAGSSKTHQIAVKLGTTVIASVVTPAVATSASARGGVVLVFVWAQGTSDVNTAVVYLLNNVSPLVVTSIASENISAGVTLDVLGAVSAGGNQSLTLQGGAVLRGRA